MRVYKFGGASVKDAEAVKNVGAIIAEVRNIPVFVVISAMGKMTNAFEKLTDAYYHQDKKGISASMDAIRAFHQGVMDGLLQSGGRHTFDDIDNLFLELECLLETEKDPQAGYDYIYDQIVCFGELISTRIVSAYLNENGVPNRWMDCRNFIVTDAGYRNATVDWKATEEIVSKKLLPIARKQIIITQGFIGRAHDLSTTTLGRDGSDYSASIFAFCLGADSVTIWKDVAGVMNGDPKKIDHPVLFDGLTYIDTVELAYYGANIIHPKTIQPLWNRNIPLYVRSFYDAAQPGTCINEKQKPLQTPVYITREHQVMMTITTKDFSFIVENHLSEIFSQLTRLHIRLHLMQHGALNFRICIDGDVHKNRELQQVLARQFEVSVKDGLTLHTVSHPETADIDRLHQGSVYMEQRSQHLLQVLKD